MRRTNNSRDKFFDKEPVICSYLKYHRASCNNVGAIEARNRKKRRSWKDAVALGLVPCRICRPYYEASPTTTPTPTDGPTTIGTPMIAEALRPLKTLADLAPTPSAWEWTKANPTRLGNCCRPLVQSSTIIPNHELTRISHSTFWPLARWRDHGGNRSENS